MMVPTLLQAPEPSPNIGKGQTVCKDLPDTSTRLTFPSAKKPRKRLSGDQKIEVAPSVPAIGCDVSAPKGRTHISRLPCENATNAMCFPSGETFMLGDSICE